MERKQLLDKLTLVAPALSAIDVIPVMQCFWFTGTHVMAYNDTIAISTPCKTDFKGAIRGTTLLELLKASKAKDIEFVVDDDANLTVKAASSRFKLGYLKPSDFVHEMPEAKQKDALPVNVRTFLDCVDACMVSVGNDTARADFLGVTVIPKKDELHLYSTNNESMTRGVVKLSGTAQFKSRIILPAQFCEQMQTLSKGHDKLMLEIFEDQALLVVGGTMLFGRLLVSEQPIDFEHYIETDFSEAMKAKLAPIPSKLRLVLERAIVITSQSRSAQASTTITVRADRMRFVSRADNVGEVVDTVLVTDLQPEVSIRLDPKMLKVGLDRFESMLMTDRCAVMANRNVTYLVAAYTE